MWELIKLYVQFELRDRNRFPGFSTLFFNSLERRRVLPSRSAASMRKVLKYRLEGRLDRLFAIIEDGNLPHSLLFKTAPDFPPELGEPLNREERELVNSCNLNKRIQEVTEKFEE